MSAGGIRANLTFASSSAGEGTARSPMARLFTVQPFGNSLVVKTLTGQQLYDLLEQQWGTNQFADGGLTLQISKGFTYKHSFVPNSSPLGSQYVSTALWLSTACRSINPPATMNSFLATGGNNFTVFNLGANQLGGDVDLDAMEALSLTLQFRSVRRTESQKVATCP
jgi:5'-nucleotidase